jgi:hypothetical protein
MIHDDTRRKLKSLMLATDSRVTPSARRRFDGNATVSTSLPKSLPISTENPLPDHFRQSDVDGNEDESGPSGNPLSGSPSRFKGAARSRDRRFADPVSSVTSDAPTGCPLWRSYAVMNL